MIEEEEDEKKCVPAAQTHFLYYNNPFTLAKEKRSKRSTIEVIISVGNCGEVDFIHNDSLSQGMPSIALSLMIL